VINLTTGTPGAGKSVLTLHQVEMRRRKENREVYYSGIADLLLPWKLFGKELDSTRPHMTDPSEWHQLPAGSIIVIDEAQRLFRKRSIGSIVPEYVTALETHRHRGLDLYLVTQHPMLIDSDVRKLVEVHQHLMRKFGSKWATIHEWKGVKEQCDKTRSDSQETEFRYPKEVFTWFKSAEVHTHKLRIPKKVLLLASLPFLIGGGAWYTYKSMGDWNKPAPGAAAAGRPGQPGSPGAPGAGSRQVQRYSAQDLASSLEPRFPGLLHTAPRYDAITKPVRAPVPVGCVLYAGDGKGSFCITQQGTRFEPPLSFIRDYATRGGMFMDFQPEPSSTKDSTAGKSSQAGDAS
jgi:zona occludens toxin